MLYYHFYPSAAWILLLPLLLIVQFLFTTGVALNAGELQPVLSATWSG